MPFSFRVYATYKVESNLSEIEKAIHNLIDKIDYDLRAREEADSGRLREREFFALDAENAYGVLREIAILRGDEGKLVKTKQTKQEKAEEQVAKTVEIQADRRKAANFSFERKGIKPGAEIVFYKDDSLKAIVLDDKYIKYNGQRFTLTGLAKKILGKNSGIAGPMHFKLNGKILRDYPDINE